MHWTNISRCHRYKINPQSNLCTINNNCDSRECISQFAEEINLELLSKESNVPSAIATNPRLTSAQKKQVNQLLLQYEDVFAERASKLISSSEKLHLKPGATSIFIRTREIPVALRDAYMKEIDRKINFEFYKKVECLEWASATPIVTKNSGKLQIAGNYKFMLN